MPELTEQERIRYGRQMQMEGWGEEGQAKLGKSRVFIAGAGGLGSPASIYLAVAGVGHITICDADQLELTNLNRQILHPTTRIGARKAVSAARTLNDLNPEIEIVAYTDFLTDENINLKVGKADLLVDCLDNYEARYLLNRYAIKNAIPLIHGAIHGMTGQVAFLHPPDTPCLRCIFATPPPLETFPVVGATPGVIGSIQALEALKFFTGIGTTSGGRLLIFEGQDMTFTSIEVRRAVNCPDCGHLQR
jgi:adenylyltransferase/sulfurtransferase